MEYVRRMLPSTPVPQVFAFEGVGSSLAKEAGAVYMLLEGLWKHRSRRGIRHLCSRGEHYTF